MHDKEVLYFTEALELLKNNFHMDAVQKLQSLIKEFPDSDLADDAEYNIALAYYDINYFEKAVEILKHLIANYPEATITVLANCNEFGRTSAKAYYLMVNCYLALKQEDQANRLLPEIQKYTDLYVLKNGVKTSFYDLSVKAIDTYKSLCDKK